MFIFTNPAPVTIAFRNALLVIAGLGFVSFDRSVGCRGETNAS